MLLFGCRSMDDVIVVVGGDRIGVEVGAVDVVVVVVVVGGGGWCRSSE